MGYIIKDHQILYVYEIKGFIKDCRSLQIPGYLGNWPEPPYNYLFFLEPVDEGIKKWLSGQEGLQYTNHFTIDYNDWQQVVEKKHHVGRFAIIPGMSGDAVEEENQDVPLYIAPCLVFGSGLHPTTSGCLAAIDILYERETPRLVIDVGTGTGILAVACAKCGSKRVIAYDINPLAVECARDNVKRNGFEKVIDVKLGDGLSHLQGADLLCFNLDENSFRRLLDTVDLTTFQWSIISGMPESQFEKFYEKLPSQLVIWSKQVRKGWLTLCLASRQ